MLQFLQMSRFANESVHDLLVGDKFGPDHFDGHVVSGYRVARQQDRLTPPFLHWPSTRMTS